MFSNLIKKLNKTYNRSVITFSSRYFTPQRENKQTKDQEDDAAREIEASLFDNCSVKYEPVKKEDCLKNPKRIRTKHQAIDIIRRPQQLSSFKQCRSEREAKSKLINDQDLGLDFFKLSLNDPRLTNLLVTARSKKKRDKDRKIVIEGRRLILEALMCGLKLNSVIFSQKEQLAEIKQNICEAKKQFNTQIYKVPQHDLKTWSTLTTPPGVMAIFDRPSLNSIDNKTISGSTPLPITVVCDNIREPNNLGSIIRICAALPVLQVVVTRGCCDPWESKALRGGCGGHFRLSIRDNVEWDEVPLMIPTEIADNFCIFIAENNLERLRKKPDAVEYSEVKTIGLHNVVIIGGESHGVSNEAYRLLDTVGQRGKSLYIPLAQGIDSLNVASALSLILYELRKKCLRKEQELYSEGCF